MTNRTKPIDGELLKLKDEILQYALDFGLDFYPVIFEVCDYDTVNILAAQGGFPNRFPHWRFGMDYDQLSKKTTYGLQRIYEMVVNTDPCYAYLLNANHLVDQKIVMAHVYGHADFFKNNLWFKNTDRSMMDVMANHGTKIRRYMERYGQNRVEDLVDKILSLENLVDTNLLFETAAVKRSRREQNIRALTEKHLDQTDDRSQALKSFMNSKLKEEKGASVVKRKDYLTQEEIIDKVSSESSTPRDIMLFIMQNAPLEEWEIDVVGILRDEAYYYLPQRLTKIMNEGWASYWHSKIMTEKALQASEIIDFADHHAGVMAMSRQNINPYKIGIELFRDIEYRWNTGMFGKEYQECTNMEMKEKWNKNLGLGRQKIFEVRKTHNDVTFIDEFFTEDFCERQQLFTYKYNPRTGRNEIDGREFEEIKSKLLSQLTNFGSPVIEVKTGNFANRKELLLIHRHQDVDLDLTFAAETMKNIYALWKRPVNMSTQQEGVKITYSFNGKEMRPLEKDKK